MGTQISFGKDKNSVRAPNLTRLLLRQVALKPAETVMGISRLAIDLGVQNRDGKQESAGASGGGGVFFLIFLT